MFGTWTNGFTLIPTISTKFKSNVLVIKNTRVNSLVDISVIRATQHKLFILAYKTTLSLYVGEFMLLLNQIVLPKVRFYSE